MLLIDKMHLNPSLAKTSIRYGLALAMAAALLTGCGSTKEKVKSEPVVVSATFEGQTIDQVRTALMVACTNDKWTIRSKTGEVSCHNNKLESKRYDVIEKMANDPVGQRYSENIRFDITQDGTTVTAQGRAWIQYVVPGGFYTTTVVNTIDLQDEEALGQIRKLLTNAKGKVN